MPLTILTQNAHIAMGLAPVADAFSGTVRSDIFNMKNFSACTFIIIKGVGTTGTSTITVNACDDTSGTNRTAIPFRYRRQSTADTWGAVTTVTTAGFDTTAGSAQLYEIIVDGQELGDTGYQYVELTAIEVVDSPVVGSILWVGKSMQPQNIPATALT